VVSQGAGRRLTAIRIRSAALALERRVDFALKIDVDTHRGLAEGVPRLATALRREGINASFYVAMGPDNSGRALMRIFRNRGFIGKMVRTRAISMYGLRTMLSGTLLPARQIALAMPGVVRSLREDGFEVGVHGYDHVRWQDRIDRLGEDSLRGEIMAGFAVYRTIFGDEPLGFAAPGWRTNSMALRLLDSVGLLYRSDTRGRSPFRIWGDGTRLKTPEIPTTLPTLDEVIGRPGLEESGAIVDLYLDRVRDDTLNVHTIHAETEGMGQLGIFIKLLDALRDRGAKFVRLCDVAGSLEPSALPVCEVIRVTVDGRAGWVAGQGPELPAGLFESTGKPGQNGA
jgi:peptidoglycan/xylan/chitin deacetylase (PgdA/CDA1 family)